MFLTVMIVIGSFAVAERPDELLVLNAGTNTLDIVKRGDRIVTVAQFDTQPSDLLYVAPLGYGTAYLGLTLALFLGCTTKARGQMQSTTAAMETVTDSYGALLPGVGITVSKDEIGTRPGDHNYYSVQALKPGKYSVTGALTGFKFKLWIFSVVVAAGTAFWSLLSGLPGLIIFLDRRKHPPGAPSATLFPGRHPPFFSALRISLLSTLICGPLLAQEHQPDQHTLLLLHFNGDLRGAAGESPTQTVGVTFEAGVFGQGVLVDQSDILPYASLNNFKLGEGTIEFWVKPTWNGDDNTVSKGSDVSYAFFSIADELNWAPGANDVVLLRDGAANLAFTLGKIDSEAHKANNIRLWKANEWHHIAVTWSIPGETRIYVDGLEKLSWSTSDLDLIGQLPSSLYIGSQYAFRQAEAVFDELRISSVARSPGEIGRSYLAGFSLSNLRIKPESMNLLVAWRKLPRIFVAGDQGEIEVAPSVATWKSSNASIASVDESGQIVAHQPGTALITAALETMSAASTVNVAAAVLQPVHEEIDPFLANPAPRALYVIPVVIFRYLPTADGVNLDVSKAPDFWSLGETSLEEIKGRIDTLDKRVKFMLEEGSRFRGYKNLSARPSIGYKVIDYITVYEQTPPGRVVGTSNGDPVFAPDFFQIFDRFDAENYVNNLGVKEFWFWMGGLDGSFPCYDPKIHKPEDFRSAWESNMSSPVTQDISNSNRDNKDLPEYKKTYLVYGQNFRRTQAEAVHNHGHQLEAMLSHVNSLQDGNTDLFWKKLVGQNENGDFITGRCGWTHMPPNTTNNYDYLNPALVPSDIESWRPDGTGVKKLVNVNTWGDLNYEWPDRDADFGQRVESQWYMYWMQNMPGYGNLIQYGESFMTNWWAFTGDWDGSIASGLGLHGLAPDVAPGERSLLFPQYVDGLVSQTSNRTRLVLRNNTGAPASGNITFRDSGTGNPAQVSIDGQLKDSVRFSLPEWGSLDIRTDGTGNLRTGAVEVAVERGDSTSISGTEIFDLLGEFVSVPSSPARAAHQAYVSFNRVENSGLAFYNPDATIPATLEIILLDNQGVQRSTRRLTLPPRDHLAVFVDEPELFPDFFTDAATSFAGTLNIRVVSGPNISVLSLLQKRSNPPAPLAVPTSPKAFTGSPGPSASLPDTLFFPQFADGLFDGTSNRTRTILRNNADIPAAGRIIFRNPEGQATPVSIGGQMRDSHSFSLPKWGTLDIQTDGSGSTLKTGPVEVIVESGDSTSISGVEIFEILGKFVSVSNSPPGSRHQIYVSFDLEENAGVALYNPDPATAAVLELILLDSKGMQRSTTRQLVLQPRQQRTLFVDDRDLFQDFFTDPRDAFTGTLNIRVAEGPHITVLSLLQKRTAPFPLLAVPTSAQAFVQEVQRATP